MKTIPKEGIIHPSSTIANSTMGKYTEIGQFNKLENTSLGDYSYTGENCIFQNSLIDKFSNIAAFVRIGPTAHPMERASLHHFTYRRMMFGLDTVDDHDFFEERKSQICHIGHNH